MAYARKNWTFNEILTALQNPVQTESGPSAHSSKHAVEGELASNKMFQKARVESIIHDDLHKDSNIAYASASKTQQKKHPMPGPETGMHSTLDSAMMATALETAFNSQAMQTHLAKLDAGEDMKVFVNFSISIGKGWVYQTGWNPSEQDMVSLLVYLKPNSHNKDLPIFHTVIPYTQHKVSSGPKGDPVIKI